MSWQVAPSHVPRSPENSSASSASLPASSGVRAAQPLYFRLDLRRSLQMHRRLVLGFALFGVFLAMVYLLSLWAVNTARSLAYVPPTPSAMIQNAVSLLIGFTFLGIVAAIVAHRTDQRVYIASDVERLMGFAPIAQLPDFSEVSDDVAKKHLMRLVERIDIALGNRRVRSCVFTGTGPGAGATTVARRVKEALDTQGRAAVVMDGAAVSLHPIVEEIEGHSAEMVLTDTAPLTASAETQGLARHADCTIVVIESGVTTRGELRTLANVLGRLHVPFVGFVLNRVRLAKADHAFRRSLKETEQELGHRKWSADRQTFETLHLAVESGRASLEPANGMAAPGAASSHAEITSTGAPLGELDPVPAAEPIPKARPSAAAAPQKPEPAQSDVASPPDEIPWRLRETPASADAASVQPRIPHTRHQEEVSSRSDDSQTSHEAAKPAPEGPTPVTLPRLSDLRGAFFSSGLKKFDIERHAAQQSAEAELLMKAIAPFEPLFNQTAPAHSSVRACTPNVEAKHGAGAHTFIPIRDPEIAPAAANGAGTRGDVSSQVAKQREFPPSKSVAPEKSGSRREGNGGHSRRGQVRAMQEEGEVSDDVQILPSKRGQYNRNDWEQRNGQT